MAALAGYSVLPRKWRCLYLLASILQLCSTWKPKCITALFQGPPKFFPIQTRTGRGRRVISWQILSNQGMRMWMEHIIRQRNWISAISHNLKELLGFSFALATFRCASLVPRAECTLLSFRCCTNVTEPWSQIMAFKWFSILLFYSLLSFCSVTGKPRPILLDRKSVV